MAKLTCDSEIYRNWYCVMFKDIDTGKSQAFEMYDGHPLDVKSIQRILRQHTIITFNGLGFDLPLLGYALSGATCEQIHTKCGLIINTDQRYWQIGLNEYECDHIDLIEVAPGQASLKIYGGRIHAPTMQDLPIEPDASITPAQRELLKKYCLNDLDLTERLYRKLLPQIQLRERMTEEYGIDLRSKSDAQIAEAVIYQGVTLAREGDAPPRKNPVKGGTTFKYEVPDFISFQSINLSDALEFVKQCEFVITDSGAPECKALDNYKVVFGHGVYRMGIGGLHSSEKSIAHHADSDTVLIDRDVASYYPSIILNCSLYPKHLGREFLAVYGDIVKRRLDAKHSGDKVTADALKITINGSFGKLGSKYSCLYAPSLLIQVTLTGQLALLMLIEAIEHAGIPVVSANTDGIVIKCPRSRQGELTAIVGIWEFWTGFETEATQYSAVYSRDVNSYVAIKAKDGEVKTKGVLASSGLQKSPAGEIVTDAVLRYLTEGASVEATVRGCSDITKFLTIRTVAGGAVDQQGKYLGKAVRWYYGVGVTDGLRYKKNGNKVGSSEGAVPCMTLPSDLPNDIDYDKYITEAKKILKSIGA